MSSEDLGNGTMLVASKALAENSAGPLQLLNKTAIQNMTVLHSGNRTLRADELFLNTTFAQALSGIFVWSALLITCHQVSSA